MRILAKYSIKNGASVIEGRSAALLKEVEEVIGSMSPVRRSRGFSRAALERSFAQELQASGWEREYIDARTYVPHYVATRAGWQVPSVPSVPARRELEYTKNLLAVRVDFRQPRDAVYSGCALMTIFRNQGLIDAGIEVVPVKAFADRMSTGVSYFEQIVWDLEKRTEADIDVPVLVLGIGG